MQIQLKSLIVIILVVFTLYSLPNKLSAISQSSISINATPENPSPDENTTITLSSYASNLDTISISWFVNNKKLDSGVGKKSFSVKAPGAGSETIVRAVIALPDGEIEKKFTIRPNVMVLLYQAVDSYVPPFYRGKAMPTSENEIRVVAMPDIRSKAGAVNSKNLVYSWKLNYTNDAGGSGYGKNSFSYINDYLEDSDSISVVASTTDGQYSSQASIDIGTTQPKISFYKNDSNLGTLWEQTLLDGHRVEGDEIIVAEPYFISPKEIRTPALVWNWFLNGNLINIQSLSKNMMPLRVENGTSGESKLELQIESKDQLLQTANKEINLQF